MDFEGIERRIGAYRERGLRLFTTCSFQSHSLVLVHILSRIDRDIPVYFLDTGYHFPETLAFRDRMAAALGLKVTSLRPAVPKTMQKDAGGKLLFTSDPEYCCQLNKVDPLDPVLRSHDVWINGVRAEQNPNRRRFEVEQRGRHDVLRFHPLLDWSARDVFHYRKRYELPPHPLEAQGYMSIGCEPCTRKIDPEMQEREARWFGLGKTECGLHTELVE